MCTCIANSRFFGRTLDVDRDYSPQLVLMPEQYPLTFRKCATPTLHFAILGTACVVDDYPLFFDAMNNHGLAMAGLNFPESCRYFPLFAGKDNIASFELIPWILGSCRTVAETLPLLHRLNVWDAAFSPDFPPSPLHWLLSDGQQTITVESTTSGLQIYNNPAGVLTNEPPFPQHRTGNYSPTHRAAGLPGDFTSQSRFQRAAYCRNYGKSSTAADFFRLLTPVTIPAGCSQLTTVLSTCCDRKLGSYHIFPAQSLSPVTLTLQEQQTTLIRKDLTP